MQAFAGDEEVASCTVFQIFSWAPFDCKKAPPKCSDTWPPYEVMRAMAFLQPVRGSGGLLQYAYYALFGYPGKDLPRTEPARPAQTPANTKGYSSTYLAMGFANVREGTQKRRGGFWVPAQTLANPIAR